MAKKTLRQINRKERSLKKKIVALEKTKKSVKKATKKKRL